MNIGSPCLLVSPSPCLFFLQPASRPEQSSAGWRPRASLPAGRPSGYCRWALAAGWGGWWSRLATMFARGMAESG